MKHLIKMLVDEMKDAQMLYDYACEAKSCGKEELASFYIARAEQRLKMFDEDHALIQKKIAEKEKEGYYAKEGKWDALYDYYMEEKQSLSQKVKTFK